MTKFIELADQDDNLHYINIAHIAVISKVHLGDTVRLAIKDDSGNQFTIVTQNNYEEIKDLIDKG